jgi:hypothetical protein
MSIVATVESLIAQAASDDIELARTSAWVACKKMREHGLRVVAPAHPPAAPKATEPEWDVYFNGVRVPGPRKARRPKPTPKKDLGDDRAWPTRIISVAGDLFCDRCGERIPIGVPMRFQRDVRGQIHEACGSFTEAR